MKKINFILFITAAMMTLSCQQHETAIEVILNSYVASIENEDIELFRKIVAHEAEMVHFGSGAGARIVGYDAFIKTMQAQHSALSETKITISDVTIKISANGSIGWATSLWNVKATTAGKSIDVSLRCTWVLEQRGSQWVIVHSHTSRGIADSTAFL